MIKESTVCYPLLFASRWSLLYLGNPTLVISSEMIPRITIILAIFMISFGSLTEGFYLLNSYSGLEPKYVADFSRLLQLFRNLVVGKPGELVGLEKGARVFCRQPV